MTKPYINVLQRSNRIGKDVEKLIKRIEELEEANKKLNKNYEAYMQQTEARERVLASLEEQVREGS